MNAQQASTVRSLLQWASSNALPRFEAELLLAHALDWSRTRLHAWPEAEPDREKCNHYRELVDRRIAGEPIAYLMGQREFWSMDLKVTPDTLIPRPETELLVERALEHIPPSAKRAIADLGTGSGAIAVALAKERPLCQITATDNSPAALAVAADNAQRHQLTNIHFVKGAWWKPLKGLRFDVIVSNPPYVAIDDQHLTQGDLPYEPSSALTAGNDGLAAIREIATGCIEHLKPDGWLLLEHGCEQGAQVRTLLHRAGLINVITRRDLAGLERITEGRAPG